MEISRKLQWHILNTFAAKSYKELGQFGTEHLLLSILKEKDRGGKSRALNFALQHASGEIIATSDADRINYLAKGDVVSSCVFRLKYAYPFYDLDYKHKLDAVVKFLETDDCYLLGRTGTFRYNNADNSIEMGLRLAENFVNNESNKSIYDYKVKHISL